MPNYKNVPILPETKQLLDEQKPDGVTFDHWIRTDPRLTEDAE